MPFSAPTRIPVWLAAATATLIALGLISAPAAAGAPATAALPTYALGDETDDEGGTRSLREQLDTAVKGYLDAKAALDKSTKQQKKLAAHLTTLEAELVTRNEKITDFVGAVYRRGRLSAVTALLNSNSPEGFLDRTAALDAIAAEQDRHLRELIDTRDRQSRTKAALDNEIRKQRKQLDVMAKRKQQAERALALANSGQSSSGIHGTNSVTAKPAPRNADGSWPPESCSIKDPTTSGCITPRTLHALNQAKAAGFTRYVSCHRPGSWGEHPLGRACDFAAQKGGFGGVATGGDRTYGDNLTAFYIRNASRLGVLYVIWYKQIWLPSSGWKAYRGGGDPSSDHTNHVHLSVY